MGYTVVGLEEKISAIYPEIAAHGILVNAVYNDDLDAYIVTFRKDMHTLSTHLEKKDADSCLDGLRCIYLGVQIGQFIKNFEGEPAAGSVAQQTAKGDAPLKVDGEGYLVHYDDWNESAAALLAEREGLKGLSREQMEVLKFIRDYFLRYNYFPIVSALCKNVHLGNDCMNERFMTPLQAWKIAGLPQPDAVMQNLLEHGEPPT